MSETDFHTDLGRKVEEYAQAKKQLQELVEATRKLGDHLSALGFGIWMPDGGELRDETKALKALSGLPADLSIDFLRAWMVRAKEVRGRYLDLKSQLKPYGVE